jgi:predicted RNase H-like nuclease (RuvC/YqgF family)
MSEYNFEYETLYDKIRDLEVQVDKIRDLEIEVERLKTELIETDNAIYEILNRLDSMDQTEYTVNNPPNGKPL